MAGFQVSISGRFWVSTEDKQVDGFPDTPPRNADGTFVSDVGLLETTADIDAVIAVAPEAQVVVFEFGSSNDNALHMLDQMATTTPLSNQLTSSWNLGADSNYRAKFQRLAVQGQSFSQASGDFGAYSSLVPPTTDSKLDTVTSVGGTQIFDAPVPLLLEATWTGGGGGIVTGVSIPAYQQGLDMQANHGSTSERNQPDVAMVADSAWFYLTDSMGVQHGPPLDLGVYGVGTSLSSPLWAGFIALVNQQNQASGLAPVGFANPALYAIGKIPALYAGSFTDIQDGISLELLSRDSNGNQVATPSNFSAVPGYDLATGLGSPTCGLIDQLASTSPTTSRSLSVIAAGGHACAWRSGRTVSCWGNDDGGELGNGIATDPSVVTPFPIPAKVPGLSGVQAISAGSNFSCALLSGGTAECWGDNSVGELGDGTITSRLTPTPVQGLSGAQAIVSGGAHTCALLSDGTVSCWGYNTWGQLGDGTTTDRLTPVPVPGLTGVVAISVDTFSTFALLSNGTVKSWGANNGLLGDGTTTHRSTPVNVTGLTGVRSIAGTCALLLDGTVKCWGSNLWGLLGNGTVDQSATSLVPVAVQGLTGVVALGFGEDASHRCAVLSGGTVKCWGVNTVGQLGNGTTTGINVANPSPIAVQGLNGAVAVSCGLESTHALMSDGTILSWGGNGYGELGDGTTVNRLLPVQVNFPN